MATGNSDQHADQLLDLGAVIKEQAAALNAAQQPGAHGKWSAGGKGLVFGADALERIFDDTNDEVHRCARILDKIRTQNGEPSGIRLGLVVTGDTSVLTPDAIAAAEKELAAEEASARTAAEAAVAEANAARTAAEQALARETAARIAAEQALAAATTARTPVNAAGTAPPPADQVPAKASSQPNVAEKTPGIWLEDALNKGSGEVKAFRQRWNKEVKPALMAAGQTVIQGVSLGGGDFSGYDFSDMTIKAKVFYSTNSFNGADFKGSDLTESGLTLEKLKKAVTDDNTKPPSGVDPDELSFQREKWQERLQEQAAAAAAAANNGKGR